MNRNKGILIIFAVIVVVMITYIAIGRTSPHTTVAQTGSSPSPLVDPVNMVNAKGQHVDKWVRATFQTVDTNQTFQYSEIDNEILGEQMDYDGYTVNNCITSGCGVVYFIDNTYSAMGPAGILAVFNNNDNPIIGKIVGSTFYVGGKEVQAFPIPSQPNESVTYTIAYDKNGATNYAKYSSNLCGYNKGGGYTCQGVNPNNVPVIFTFSSDGSIKNILLSGKITEAHLISYQYYTIPDTGQVYPVVTVQK
jgi:hypothetical protein